MNHNICLSSFAVLHINIRIHGKKLWKVYKNFLKTLKSNFSAIYLSETLFESLDSTKNWNYRLHGYKSFHQTRDGHKVGGLGNFLWNKTWFKYKSDTIENAEKSQSKNLKIMGWTVNKKADVWYIEWQRVAQLLTMCDPASDNE